MAESSPDPKPRTRKPIVPDRVLTYEITFDSGRVVRVDIPSSYKITFGPIAGVKGYEGTGNAFRAWEAETRQRILFTKVASFRDVSLPMSVRAVRRFGTEVWFRDDGSWTGDKARLVERAWRPSDELVDQRDPNEEEVSDGDFDGPKSLVGMGPRKNRPFTVGGSR